MSSSFLLPSSYIFENSNLIDRIRQTCMDLTLDRDEEEIQDFLKEAIIYIRQDLEENVINELFPAILTCFSKHPIKSLPVLPEFLNNVKINSNYVIITASILSKLTHIKPQLNIPDYQFFVNEALAQILAQIKNEKSLKIFDHEILLQYKNNLIFDLLLSSNLTEKLVFDFFPFLYSHFLFTKNQKVDLLLQDLNNLNLFKILQQTEKSNNELIEFILTKNFDLIAEMSAESLSLIKSAIFYLVFEEKKEIEGLSKDTILPFISTLVICIQKIGFDKFSLKSKISDIFHDSIKFLENENSEINNALNDLIFKNLKNIYDNQLISIDDSIEYLEIFLKQLTNNKSKSNKMNFISAIFDSSTNIEYEIFLNSNFNEIFSIFIENLSEIKNCEFLNEKKMNLSMIRSNHINNLIENSETDQNLIQILYFIENFCSNEKVDRSQKISEKLAKIIQAKTDEKSFDDSLLINRFMKKHFFEIPELANSLNNTNSNFECFTNEDENIENLIKRMLLNPSLEKDEKMFEELFNRMIKENDELLQIFLTYLVKRYGNHPFDIKVFMRLYSIEFEKYGEKFMNVVNDCYFFNKKEKTLLRNNYFTYKNLPISEFGTKIADKLLKEAEEKEGNYQSILCLKSISSSFPFLFLNNYEQRIFEFVKNSFNYFSLIFDENQTEEQKKLCKTALSSMTFLLSVFQLPIMIDKFLSWLLPNIESMNNYQICGFIYILNIIIEDWKVSMIMIIYINKNNFFTTLGKLLKREIKEKNVRNWFKKSIFHFISLIYQNLSKISKNEMIQIDELSKVEYPIDHIFEFQFFTFTWIYLYEEIKIDGISNELHEFVNESNRPREFWIYYNVDKNRKNDAKSEIIDDFMSKLNIVDPEIYTFEIPRIPDSYTIKMIRYLVVKPQWLYAWFLSNKSSPLIPKYFDLLKTTIDELNTLLNNAFDDQEDEDNYDVSLFDQKEYILPFYCQHKLLKNLIKQIEFSDELKDEVITELENAIKEIVKNDISLLSILEFISQFLNSKIECNSKSSKVLNLIFDIFENLSELDNFKVNFIDLCGNQLIDFVLLPKNRSDKNILQRTSELLIDLKTDLPIRVTHLIGFIFVSNETEKKTAIKLCSKFNSKQIANINEIILNSFDEETNKDKLSETIFLYLENVPWILEERMPMFLSILSTNLEKYFINESEEKDENSLKLITKLFNALAPKRRSSTSLSIVIEKSTIPQNIKENFPQFWSLFEKYSSNILRMIENEPTLLNSFHFLLEYPELLSFKIRSSYFRRKMKERLNGGYRLNLRVDRKNLLTTSFRSFRNKSTDDLLRRFRVDFRNEDEIDLDGPTREWFTELAKEIFNQNYGLFDCSIDKKCYKPSNLSSINPNHLDYFKFAGQFIARALIQGQCVDAHLTTSFCKQILHRELNLIDIEDADEQLYQNLVWMLNNDVDSLCMFFEITVKELGVVKTIPLKENGSEIPVTNENKKEYVYLRTNYALKNNIEEQIEAFCEGFDSLIAHDDIKMFTPNELDLLICGIPKIDVNDFIENIQFEEPFSAETPVVKMFFNVISKWDNEKLAKLLLFMTGSSRVPSNGFKEFVEMTNRPLKISPGGGNSNLPQAHTCFNNLCLPEYESEEELNEKILFAIQECNTFEMA